MLQLPCLHDLLWFFVAALEAKGDSLTATAATSLTAVDGASAAPGADEANSGKEAKNKKNSEVAKPAAAANASASADKDGGGGGGPKDQAQELCEHPTSDVHIAGEAVNPLPETFHSLLQTISDLMLLLPVGSSLQQVAVRCWGIKFRPSDHHFLHQSHVFSTISRILSRSEELDNTDAVGAVAAAPSSGAAALSYCEPGVVVERTADVTSSAEIKVCIIRTG